MDNVTPLWPRRKKPAGAKVNRRRASIGAIAALVFVLLIVASRALGFYTDWLWFGEVNLRVVFWRSFWWQLGVGAAFAALFFIVIYVNLLIARRLAPRFKTSSHEDLVEFASEGVQRLAGRLGLAIAAVIGLIAGIAASSSWLTFARATHSVAFGIKDPIFHHDLSFYVFALPAWHFVQNFLVAAVIVSMLASAAMHLVLGGIEYTVGAKERAAASEAEHGGPRNAGPHGLGARPGAVPDVTVRLQGRAVGHLSALLGLVFVLVGIGQLFKAWGLLYSKAGAVFGAGYTDVHARLPIIRIEMAICFILAAALFVNIWRRRQYWPAAIAVWIVLLILLQGIVPALMQSLIVNPNQLAKERSYIANNIAATRTAYNLDEIAQQPLAMDKAITADTLATNDVTVRNIRLWDPQTLTTSYIALQQQQKYYNFVDADVDRYTINGVYRQTMLSPRELDTSGLKSTAQTWVNQHITYTHGYGVAVSAVNQFTPDGSPTLLVQDMPVKSVPGLEITEPRIYFGEIGTGYSLVKTKVQEFDYPGPNGDVYHTYDGNGGIPISPLLNRLAFCVRFGTINFFTTSAIDSDSRIIIRNNIADRMKAAAPFLKFDKDPYMVISGGRLYWIADAYTTTNLYPYSTPEGDLNYIRNSVKVVIDAYNGTMTFYAFDANDPLLRAYERIFPGMFTPAAQMPVDLMKHVRYPEDYFNAQSQVFATYHVTDPSVLYNKGDQWQIPEGVALSGAGPMSPYYVIMKLPGAAQEEFLLMLPFVPNGRDNMVSWLGAESDPPNYGKAVNFLFGKSTTVYGPAQVEAAINQDASVSAQRTLWDQAGSTVIMGNLVVVPIEQTLLYVQPLFLQSQQTKLPQLKRVIVFYRAPSTDGTQGGGRQVVSMQPTLAAALNEIFGPGTGGPGTPTTGPTTGPGTPTTPPGPGGLSAQARQLIAQADQQFNAAVKAQRAGDWAEYGRQIQLLQQTLSQLQQLH
jgi:uncharacterized membrane protein (UPF0182 family)